MEKTTTTAQPVCAEESLALLNCVASVPYDRDRCLALVDALRECIVRKRVKKFSLAEPSSTTTTEALKSDTKP
uniref:CHCH domain containing protein n=1 Tax=Zea mays TaxID=4577 RepID=B6TTG2_MAIZE|nr:CHCH domain containing protein [Zea mays]